ncbi:hypothetical protein DFP72DRAFT_1070857 [Ephemerocybe angulata]|uniref:Uncharacterized protein n=1 Tax=Ephemerocybe angulata TaxID=980116 RepID=A0A8H6M4F0_9AGAR|nr:hypothetical protein DFP72DRAFT_1070857 [Tulosesus angulatus]
MPRISGSNSPYLRRSPPSLRYNARRDSHNRPALRADHFLRQIQARHIHTPSSSPAILQYDSGTGELAPWYWPGDRATGRHLPPDELQDHRRTHKFRAPCCLCSLLDDVPYVEAEIAVVESLPLPHADREQNRTVMHGEYVAACATNRCGYFICLERFYELNGLRLHVYEERDVPRPVEVLANITEVPESFRNGDGLFQVMPDVMRRGSSALMTIEDLSTALERRGCLMSDLMMGIPDSRFWELFVQCQRCATVMLREPFSAFHQCNGSSLTMRFTHRPAWVPESCRSRAGPSYHHNSAYDTLTEIESASSESDREDDSDLEPVAEAASSDDPPAMIDILNDAFNNRPN